MDGITYWCPQDVRFSVVHYQRSERATARRIVSVRGVTAHRGTREGVTLVYGSLTK